MIYYTLLNNNNIVVGPRDWNAKYFEFFLKQLDIETTLPESPIREPLIFGESIKLVLTLHESLPDVNTLFEVLSGPNFRFDDYGNHIAYYIAQELSVDTVKQNLKSKISEIRWIKETSNIIDVVGGKQITIYTDKQSRSNYQSIYLLADDNYSSNWKFPEGFVTLTKEDLFTLITKVQKHVQDCFDWEANKYSEIDSKTNVEELRQIIME